MKFAELKDLTSDELQSKLQELSKELFEARFQKATHQLNDTAIFSRKRHQVAQIQTVLRNKQLQAQGEKAHV